MGAQPSKAPGAAPKASLLSGRCSRGCLGLSWGRGRSWPGPVPMPSRVRTKWSQLSPLESQEAGFSPAYPGPERSGRERQPSLVLRQLSRWSASEPHPPAAPSQEALRVQGYNPVWTGTSTSPGLHTHLPPSLPLAALDPCQSSALTSPGFPALSLNNTDPFCQVL